MILAFGGSLRTLSANAALARAAVAAAPGVVTLAPVELDALPFYDQDVEDAGLPSSVATLRSATFSASAFLFATPECTSQGPTRCG